MSGRWWFSWRLVGQLGLVVWVIGLSTLTPALAARDVRRVVSAPVYGFDGNDFADLAVGVPWEDVTIGSNTYVNAGAVSVLYGGTIGLSATGDQLWHQGSVSVEEDPEADDEFGAALAAGDFDGDGRADLAVGVPYESVGSTANAGVVHVLYGGPGGLSASGNQLWHQDVPEIDGAVETGDQFGWALAVGDFNGDGRDDLAVGVPYENVGSTTDAGVVHVLYGGPGGLSASGNQLWRQGAGGVLEAAEADDFFGRALTAGDFNGDGRADLAVGVPFEDITIGSVTYADVGAVNVLYGGSSGLSASGNQLWHQDVPEIDGAVGAGDQFGFALTAGDFSGDGRADLAVGVPLEDVGSTTNAGAVNVLYGGSSGLSASGNQLWRQGAGGVLEAAEADDFFGRALTAGDFNGDGRADLAVGVPLEDIPIGSVTYADAGAVNVLYGGSSGLSATGDQLWHQGVPGIDGAVETGDQFGRALAAGDFSGDGRADLAVGVPFEDITIGSVTYVDAGAVAVLYGGSSGLSATGDQLWYQDVSGIEGMSETGDQFGRALAAAKRIRHTYLPTILREG